MLNAELLREDDTVIHKALREALANALIHADYRGRQGIVIEKEFRKITFSNPGTFRISIEEAIGGGISDARNGHIFNMFSLIKVGERSGTGLCDIYSLWDKFGFERPIITETMEPDRVTLTLQIESGANIGANSEIGVNDSTNTGANDEIGANVNINTGANHSAKRSARAKNEQAILAYLAHHPNTTTKVIADTLHLSPRSVQRYLADLQKENIIRNDGTRKNFNWIILH